MGCFSSWYMGIPSFSINRKRLFLMSGPCRFDPGFAISRIVPFRSLRVASFHIIPRLFAFFRIFPRFFCVLYAVIHGLHPLTLGIHFISRSRESPPVSVLLCGNSLRGTWESPPFRMLFGVFASPFRIPSVWRLFVRTLRFFGVLRKHNRTLRKPWFLSVRERLRSVGRSG